MLDKPDRGTVVVGFTIRPRWDTGNRRRNWNQTALRRHGRSVRHQNHENRRCSVPLTASILDAYATFQITIAKRLNQHGFGQIRHRQIALIAPNLMTRVLSHDSLTCSGKFECFQRCVHFPGRGWEGRSGRGSARGACSTRRCEAGLV